ncbi:MAG: hypothetical protein JWP35_270 [Caulobacter sp.]|nr:hypothetical protein [Caulobacter sp.]
MLDAAHNDRFAAHDIADHVDRPAEGRIDGPFPTNFAAAARQLGQGGDGVENHFAHMDGGRGILVEQPRFKAIDIPSSPWARRERGSSRGTAAKSFHAFGEGF